MSTSKKKSIWKRRISPSPSTTVLRSPLDEFLVKRAAAVQVAQLQLHLDVSLKYFLAGRLADGPTEQETSGGEIARAQLKMRGVDPKLAKRERFVRYDSEGGLAHGTRAHDVAAIQLFKYSVLDPQEHVAPPRTLLGTGRHLKKVSVPEIAMARE